jgi:hypothetical protein
MKVEDFPKSFVLTGGFHDESNQETAQSEREKDGNQETCRQENGDEKTGRRGESETRKEDDDEANNKNENTCREADGENKNDRTGSNARLECALEVP